MSAAGLQSEFRSHAAAHALSGLRVQGGIRAAFGIAQQTTRVSALAESGGYRVRFPRTHADHAEAVIINTDLARMVVAIRQAALPRVWSM
jgi:urease accessory protein